MKARELDYKVGRKRIRAGSVAWWTASVFIGIIGAGAFYMIYCSIWIASI